MIAAVRGAYRPAAAAVGRARKSSTVWRPSNAPVAAPSADHVSTAGPIAWSWSGNTRVAAGITAASALAGRGGPPTRTGALKAAAATICAWGTATARAVPSRFPQSSPSIRGQQNCQLATAIFAGPHAPAGSAAICAQCVITARSQLAPTGKKRGGQCDRPQLRVLPGLAGRAHPPNTPKPVKRKLAH